MSPISYKFKNMRQDGDKDHIQNLAANLLFFRVYVSFYLKLCVWPSRFVFNHCIKMVGLILHGRNCRSYSRCTRIRPRPLAPFLSPVVFSYLTEGKLQWIVWKTDTLKALQIVKVILYSYFFRISFVQDTQLFQEEGVSTYPIHSVTVENRNI